MDENSDQTGTQPVELSEDELSIIAWGGDGGANLDYDPEKWNKKPPSPIAWSGSS